MDVRDFGPKSKPEGMYKKRMMMMMMMMMMIVINYQSSFVIKL